MPEPSVTKPIGLPFIELQSVDSTNNYAREQIHLASLPDRQVRQAGRLGLAQHGVAFFAHEQVAGKGQRGKVWASEKGANIILSLLVKPNPLRIEHQFQLSACMAVAVHEFFAKYAGDDAKIKWPNDLYWQDRKAGGMLIESLVGSRESGVGSWEWSIIGIGININQTFFLGYLPNPVSLKQITGSDFKVVPLAKELCSFIQNRFAELISNGFDNIYHLYNQHLYKQNETVRLKKGNRVFEAVIKSVTPSGRLLVRHVFEEEFDFGDVEWVIS